MLHDALLLSIILYGSEIVVWKDKKRSKIRAVKMDNIRDLLSIKRMD